MQSRNSRHFFWFQIENIESSVGLEKAEDIDDIIYTPTVPEIVVIITTILVHL